MIHIGIDFSLNSPAVCVKDHNGSYQFFSFFNFGDRELDAKKIPKAFEHHKTLADDHAIIAIPYNRKVSSKDFLQREREKLIDGKDIAELIINHIIALYGTINVKVALEGFSYGSTGNSFIDIVQYNTFLRSMLLTAYGADKIYIMQPSHVKKLAGKGNANKHFMAKAFQDNVLNDDNLRKTKFWDWAKDKDFSEKIPKPVDDLIDSYFILNTIEKIDH
jgi:hypothetical protein